MSNVGNLGNNGSLNISTAQPSNNNILVYESSNGLWNPVVATGTPLNLVDQSSTQTLTNKTLGGGSTLSSNLAVTGDPNIGTAASGINNIYATNVATGGLISNIGAGTTIYSSAHLVPNSDNTYELGISTQRWGNLYVNNIINGAGSALSVPTSGYSLVTTPNSSIGATIDNRLSYTPTLGDGTNNVTMTTQTGLYAQYGNTYHVCIHIIWSSKGSASGQARISLPVTSANNGLVNAFCLGYNNGLYYTSTQTQVMVFANPNANYLYIYNNGSAGPNPMTIANMGTSGELQVSGWITT